MNLMMLLEMAASGVEDRVAFKTGEATLTYGELFRAAGSAATLAKDAGAERFAILDVSSLAVPVALFAGAWAGLPFVPLNYRLTGNELDDLLDEVSPSYLVTDADKVAALSSRAADTVIEREAFLESARSGAARGPDWGMDGEDIGVLLFTSGTTGKPKAAVLRHKHLVSYIFGSVEFGSAAEDDAALVCVPPYHIAGIAAIMSSVYSGRRVVQLSNFSAEGWLEVARKEAVTNAFVVPTMLARIVDVLKTEGGGANLPSLRALSYGGGKMPQSVIEASMELFPGVDFTNAYGLTETSSTITLLGPQDHRDAMASDDPAVRRRIVSVGRPLPSVEVEVRDPDGNPLGPFEAGEIFVRGEQVSGEYLGRGSSVGSDGWFPTRDGGSIDEGGYLFIEGRTDDVIVRGGENLSPGEIEDVLLEHESVADCAVVGVPDRQWGEAVAAVIVTKPGCDVEADALRDMVKGRLRSSRTPERVEFWDELPYNETGKLLRRKVKARLAEAAS
jgi:acyl-CoA synthetase (AMP-forming)/AMP-acid ligase II